MSVWTDIHVWTEVISSDWYKLNYTVHVWLHSDEVPPEH